jgi:hypothetical protein
LVEGWNDKKQTTNNGKSRRMMHVMKDAANFFGSMPV